MRSTSKFEGSVAPGSSDKKVDLRKRMRAILTAMPTALQQEASSQALALLGQQKRWKESKSILFYAPLPGELDVWPLLVEALAAGRTVALPRFISQKNLYAICPIADFTTDLEIGHFGVREPAAHCQPMAIYRLDFVLVPGVAFDLHGRRLGRGRGFYDQLLPFVLGKTCGVAFDEQIVEAIPVESHDVLVNSILTPTRWIEL